jgi:hypothetical protein
MIGPNSSNIVQRPNEQIGFEPVVTTRPGDGNLPVNREQEKLDKTWSGQSLDGRGIFEYYDYYYTGEDVKIFIDGVEPPDADAALPMVQFAFKVTQQKTPVYGFWSFTYDAVLRGSRMVQGVFRIATTSTDYMTRVIGKAAQSRSQGNTAHEIRELNGDENNIERYWGRHLEPGKNLKNNIFSIHPPFNFVVVYGISDLSACNPPAPRVNQYVIDKYNTGFGVLSDDENHTIIEVDQENNSMRRIIESVEIVDMQVEYDTTGQVCSELYSFMARDVYYPSPSVDSSSVASNTHVPSTSLPDYLALPDHPF